MILLNFGHPFTPEQKAQLERIAGRSMQRIVDIAVQLDEDHPFRSQAVALADKCGLTTVEWQTLPLVIVPPMMSYMAVVLLVELHGRMGHFPACVRLRPAPNSVIPEYEVAELVNLQAARASAREHR